MESPAKPHRSHRLLIVIVNYNGFGLTRDCLETVAQQINDVPGTTVGLCDNGSEPGEAERLRTLINERGWGGWCELTAIQPNLGFTGGNNVIIEPAFDRPPDEQPEYTLLLNNDTLLREGALLELVRFMDGHPDAGCAGARLEDPDGTPQVAAFNFFSPRTEFESLACNGVLTRLSGNRTHRIEPIPEGEPVQVDWVAGASLIIRDVVIRDVGLLDAEYYTYFDDIDFCQSAAKKGHLTWYVPASRIVHLGGQTTGINSSESVQKRRPAYWFEARRRYWLKHHGRWGAIRADLAAMAGVAACRLRLPKLHPKRFLRDHWDHSVLRRGAAPVVVQNPALPAGAPNRLPPNPAPAS